VLANRKVTRNGKTCLSGKLVVEDRHQGGTFGLQIRQTRLPDATIPQTPSDIMSGLFDDIFPVDGSCRQRC